MITFSSSPTAGNTLTTEDERYIKGLTEPIAEEDPEE